MLSPSPIPSPTSRVVKKGSKIFPKLSGLIPEPLSQMLITEWSLTILPEIFIIGSRSLEILTPDYCTRVSVSSGMGFNFLRHGSLGVFGRRPIAQRAVWSLSIIIKPPSFKFFFHFSQRNKYLGVKKFIAQASIEAFNIDFLRVCLAG